MQVSAAVLVQAGVADVWGREIRSQSPLESGLRAIHRTETWAHIRKKAQVPGCV